MALGERFRVVIAFEADQDIIPGWGHQIEDWVDLFMAPSRCNSHYNVTGEVIETKEIPRCSTGTQA